MAGINGELTRIITYSASDYDFQSPIKNALCIDDDEGLPQLHRRFDIRPVVNRENDSKTAIHSLYYKNIAHTDFYSTYRHFVGNVITDVIGEPFIIQRIPSFRVHLPGNKAVGEYHRDRDFGHQDGAINFWLPVTNAYDTNTLHIVPDDSEPPLPINVSLGEVLAFDAVNLRHGNEVNQTEETRVSFDFRVIPERDYIESRAVSINTMARLALGSYYTHPEDL